MKVTFDEVNDVVKTLPIGYYATRDIPLVLKEDADCSYYVPTEDNIVISYSQVAKGLETAKDDTDYKEVGIRSIVYHEVSHAILTPKYMTIDNVMNIFEDERIETLLAKFYMDVNFKKNVFMINGGFHEATNAESAFYNLVRFRICKDKTLLNRVDEIIKKYKKLCRISEGYEGTRHYERDVHNLYADVARMWDADPDKFNSSDFNGDIKAGESGESSKGMSGIPSDGDSEDGEMSGIGEEDGKSESESDIREEMKNIFKKVLNPYSDDNLTNQLSAIIANFNKKNKGGNGINTYSGVFNPRAVVRSDYRYFERSASVNGNNRFGKFHLNLWLDNSGSYCSNQKATNVLIESLIQIEKKNPNFSFDTYFIASRIQKGDRNTKKGRYINAHGGNWLMSEIFDTFNKAQEKGCYNYNIVMFDGDAFSADVPRDLIKDRANEPYKNMLAFNNGSTTIITDYYNGKYLKKVHSARIIYTRDFVGELNKNIFDTLSVAFR